MAKPPKRKPTGGTPKAAPAAPFYSRFERKRPVKPEAEPETTAPPATGKSRGPKAETGDGPGRKKKPAGASRKPVAEGPLNRIPLNPKLPAAPVRLNRYIAQSGVCARRKADEYIVGGLVRVNGVVVTELGSKITPGRDSVSVNGKVVTPQQLVYLLLNKPKNHLTTLSDPEGRRTVLDLIEGATPERVYPVGRLDRNTTGVLLLTNDGTLAKKLAHPASRVRKVYRVGLDRPLAEADLARLREGFELEDGPIHADAAGYVPETDGAEVEIVLHSGRNRIVRRMFEFLGYEVASLDRTAFGPLTKKGLRRGHYRFLLEKEVGFLRMI
ncbi:MAG: pseudouridine synthase [Bacteroidia bacterium]|nr:pseudouridine synthase [Bacteroidia bacterium]